MSFDLKAAIGTIAPTLATMLGGPLAGTAVAALTQALGLSPGSTQDDVTKAVAAGMSPDTIAAVRAADQKHLEILGQQQIDLAKLNADYAAAIAATDAGDRDSARKREMSVMDWTPRLLAWGVTIGFFGVLWFMLTQQMPAGAHDALLILLGALQAGFMSILTYYFGSSSGSAEKTRLLGQQNTGVK